MRRGICYSSRLRCPKVDIPQGVVASGLIGPRRPAYPSYPQVDTLRYKSSVHYLDALFGQLIDEIMAHELLDRSVIVFTADRGEVMRRLNARLAWLHGFALAPEVLRVPLTIRWPAAGAGRYEGVTRSIDVFPTLAGIAQLTIPDGLVSGVDLSRSLVEHREREGMLAFSHTALAPLLRRYAAGIGLSSVANEIPAVPTDMWVSLVDGGSVYKLTRRAGHGVQGEVYDWEEDPGEMRNRYIPMSRCIRR